MNLIICPVGNPLTFDSRFDMDNHWRYTNKQQRDYETILFQYGSFVPEENSYDSLIKKSGQKWELMKDLLSSFDYSKYEYIGFFDDDLITDINSINKSLSLAKQKNLKIFQMSMTHDSDVFYPILRNKPSASYSKTNFIEIMGPFIHSSLIPLVLDLWSRYDIVSGWGFDKVLCALTKENAAVIHECQMYHPKKESSYDKTKAFAEMDLLTQKVFPKFMDDKYGEIWFFNDQQRELELFLKTN
jgi:hypothetical protein